jgi:hypothetical protein
VHDDETVRPLASAPKVDRNEIGDFEDARWAWQQLGANAHYFFQYPEWLEVIAALAEGDVAWGVLSESGRPAAASVLRRAHLGLNSIGVKALMNVSVKDIWMYPFTDCVLDLMAVRNNHIDLDDVLRASGTWHALRLSGLRIGSPWLELAVGRARVQEEIGGGVGILDTRQGVDSWRRTLPKNMRDTIRKVRGRVATFGEAKIAVSTGTDLPAAYEQFVALEASGWKGTQGTAILQSAAWCELLGHYLEATNGAQIRSLDIEGRIAASQLCVKVGRTLVLLKVAYDEQLAHLSPGNLLMANLAEECCEDPAIDRIDCTVWQDWHQRWGMAREPTFELFAFNHRSIRGVAVGATWNARRILLRQQSWRVSQAAPVGSE